MAKGIIVTIVEEKGYGFIRPEGQQKNKDLFFHATGMVNRIEFADLAAGDFVGYDIDDAAERPRAINVQAVK